MKNEGCSHFSVNPCTPASHWHCLLKLKRKKNPFKIIIGFFFTPPLFLAIKVAISFVYCSPKTIKCTQKPKIKKKFTGIEQASKCHSLHHIYNSLLRMRTIHELKKNWQKGLTNKQSLYFSFFAKEGHHGTQ